MCTFRMVSRWIVAAALAGCAMLVHAMPISGAISIGGSFQFIDDSTGTSIGIDFSPAGGTGGAFVVTSSSGDFSSIPFFTVGSIKDFQFAPFIGPINNFWDLSSVGFTFDLTSITNVVKSLGTGAISLTGIGVINSTIAGLDSTRVNWSLAGDTTNGVDFGWSSTTVPEPMTSALLGIGLLGFGFARVVKKQRYLKVNQVL